MSNSQQKLEKLFLTLPAEALGNLRQLMEIGNSRDPDKLPYHAIIKLIDRAAKDRGIEFETKNATPSADSMREMADRLKQTLAASKAETARKPAVAPIRSRATIAQATLSMSMRTEDIQVEYGSRMSAPEVQPEPAMDEVPPDEWEDIKLSEEIADEPDLKDSSSEYALEAPVDEEPLLLDEVSLAPERTAEDKRLSEPEPIGLFEPPRNAMHAFFLPLSALIIDPPKFQPRLDGYLCSTSLPAIWRLLNDEASGAVIQDAWLRAELLAEPGDQAFYEDITEQMYEASIAMVDDLALKSRNNPAFRRALVNRFGSQAVLGDFFEFQTLLPRALKFQAAFARIKPLLKALTPRNLNEISMLIAEQAEKDPALGGYLQLAIVSSLERPWLALQLHATLKHAGNTANNKLAGQSLILDHLMSVLKVQPEWLTRVAITDPFTVETHRALSSFARLATGAINILKSLDDDEGSVARIKKEFKHGRSIYRDIIKRAGEAVQRVLPMAAGADGQRAPDTAWRRHNVAHDELVETALLAAQFIEESEELADTLNCTATLSEVRTSLSQELVTYSELLIEQIGRNVGPPREQALQMLDYLGPLTAVLLGDEQKASLAKQAETASQAA